ncbi:NUC188 domain-containing protein [Armillaria novae-zelandiae]|uniref:NUC188 domain-containing protein n=1 Tax=Armillaria novae-zelandiae TaxID=153914 RepID=A0AA39PP73_9AGAR|nr:NUC188 domain-containing protein [Armillaria novae-zelandiae]
MAPKRPSSGEGLSGRERKKLKMADARTIAVQPVQSNAEAGPSRVDSMARLPGVIDVEAFTEARSFEINAMQNAMKTASSSSTQRAWQALPRHLRRRAASHDVRRVPVRLREKAKAEMDVKKVINRQTPKRGKDKRVPKAESFLKRQRDKTWLETHLWHAKRMKMENMWGYRLAVHPSEKAFRPSHRAAVRGSILHDASYQSLIELKGSQTVLTRIMDNCCDPQELSPGNRRYVLGARTLSTHMYQPTLYPCGLIAPITIMWRPFTRDKPEAAEEPDEISTEPTQAKRKRKGKGKEKVTTEIDILPNEETIRVVWIRSHPATHDEVFNALQAAASSVLDEINQESRSDQVVDVEIADLRGKVNVFEIMGPKSSQILKGALQPIASDDRTSFNEFWSSLADVQTTGSLPRGMIVGFAVNDPRLKFPPKNAKLNVSTASNVLTMPSSALAQSNVWDETARNALKTPKYKKKDLDKRRSKNAIPGTHLTPLRQDDRIPVILIQRSLESSSSLSTSNGEKRHPGGADDDKAIHGWTLIIPAGWSMAFFSSLTYTGTRTGGQRECQSQTFESGVSHFPRDYPFTSAYDKYAQEYESEARESWERKPPAKRPNFEKLGTRSPWRADWEAVLGFPEEGASDGYVSTQRGEGEEADRATPWLLRGSTAIINNLSNLFSTDVGLLAEVNRIRSKRGLRPLDGAIKSGDLLKGALVTIKVKMHKRGSPEDLAVIYSMSDDELISWEKLTCKSVADLVEDDNSSEDLGYNPETSPIIGYVTTGHFSLLRGEGFARGAVPLIKFLELREQARRLCKSEIVVPVKIRNPASETCRAAYIQVTDL